MQHKHLTCTHTRILLPQLVYIDTEGFESTARSSSYDDRIFAVAAVLSSLLIYVRAAPRRATRAARPRRPPDCARPSCRCAQACASRPTHLRAADAHPPPPTPEPAGDDS